MTNLIANEIQRRVDRLRESGQDQVPTLRYREAIFEGERAEVREIEGSAEDVIFWLRDRAALPSPSEDDES